jgi:hypothetical protein
MRWCRLQHTGTGALTAHELGFQGAAAGGCPPPLCVFLLRLNACMLRASSLLLFVVVFSSSFACY